MVHVLSDTNSILLNFLAEIRDAEIQKDQLRFRANMKRISEIMAYEVSKSLKYENSTVQTSLGTKSTKEISEKIVIASILRAGLTMHEGFLSFFDKAENAFISAYREENNEGANPEIKVHVEYLASPDLNGKTVLIVDPMLATGKSLELTLQALRKNGEPKKIHVLNVIASRQGLEAAVRTFPEGTEFWMADVDEELNKKSYIVPGLGDAGDLAFGIKL